MMANAALSLQDIDYRAGGATLLDGISHAFPRGQCTMLVGPNGAGKSLLMKISHGILPPARGAVLWARNESGPLRHTMVAQRPLMMRRTAKANLVHALALAGISYAARHRQAQAALEKFRLGHLVDKPAAKLSGGEQQRLAIARAAAIGADVIFLDEPTSALDPASTQEIEAMIAVLRSEGVTVIMSTHALPQAKRLADHMVMMHKGSIIESGPVDAFFNAPLMPQTCAFLAGDLLI